MHTLTQNQYCFYFSFTFQLMHLNKIKAFTPYLRVCLSHLADSLSNKEEKQYCWWWCVYVCMLAARRLGVCPALACLNGRTNLSVTQWWPKHHAKLPKPKVVGKKREREREREREKGVCVWVCVCVRACVRLDAFLILRTCASYYRGAAAAAAAPQTATSCYSCPAVRWMLS